MAASFRFRSLLPGGPGGAGRPVFKAAVRGVKVEAYRVVFAVSRSPASVIPFREAVCLSRLHFPVREL